MVKGPHGGIEIYKKRRQELLKHIKGGVAILPANPEYVRNNDVHYPYRQDSSFYYLTGYTEPDSVIVLDPASPSPFTFFVREKDPTRELWDGFRYGVDGAAEHFGANKSYPIKDFEKMLPDLIKNTDTLYYKMGDNKEFDELLMRGMQIARKMKGRSGLGLHSVVDVKQIVGEMRLFKSREEIANLRKATEISAQGHIAAMKATKPGMYEFEIEAIVEGEFRRRGAERLGYGSIVGTGANATVLHYVFNSDQTKAEDLLLIDAGAEYGYVTGDITRTFPVSGKFTAPQKKLYQAVLDVQKACVNMVKPGVKLADIHQSAIDGLTEKMLELGLLKGNKREAIDKREFFRYFPHGTSHWLGMDVHDSGLYTMNGEPRKLEPNMCFTVEPGLYVPAADSTAPAEFRGLGIRIEDDVVVTETGCENLTKLAPKEVLELESVIGKSV